MSQKEKIKNGIKNEFDLSEVSDISEKVSELMDKVGYEDSTSEILELDRKFVEQLDSLDGSEMKKLASDIRKKTSPDNKNSFFSNNPILSGRWSEFATVSFLILLLITTGAVAYLWPNSGDEEEFAANELAQNLSEPAVLMQPAKFTESGYVDRSSGFIFEIDGRFVNDPEEVIQVVPELPFDVTREEKGDYTILTAVPKDEMERDSEFIFSIPADTQFVNGEKLEEDLDWSIIVDPKFSVVTTLPFDGQENVPIDTNIRINLNHKNVSLSDFEQNFTIQPDIEGEFISDGRSMIFTPLGELDRDTEYTVSVSPSLVNSTGEALDGGLRFSFTTSDILVDSRTDVLEPRWIDYSGREIVQMSGTVVTSSSFPKDDDIRYELKQFDESTQLSELINQFLAEGTLPTQIDSDPIDTQELSSDEYYSFRPERNGLFLLKAVSGDQELYRLINFSDIGIVVVEDGRKFTGWVVDLVQSQRPDQIEVLGYKDGELVEEYELDQDRSFQTGSVDYLIVSSPAGDAVWLSGWDLESVSWRDPYTDVDEQIELLTDQPFYSFGQKIDYYIYFGDFLERKLASTDYSDLSLALEVTQVGQDRSYMEILRERVEMDIDDLSVSGTLTIPSEEAYSLVRLVLYNNETELGSRWLNLVPTSEKQQGTRIETSRDRYLLGESIKVGVTGTPGSALQVNVYSDQIDNSLLHSDYFTKSLFWGADQFVRQYEIVLDESGKGEVHMTPYDRADSTAYHSYTMMLVDPETGALIDAVSVGVAESLIVMDVSTVAEGLISEDDTVSIKFSSVNPWTLDPVGNIAFSFFSEISEEVYFSRGQLKDPYTGELLGGVENQNSVTKRPVSLFTDEDGSVSHQISDLQVGTYLIHTQVGNTQQQIGEFEVVSEEVASRVVLGMDGQELLIGDRVTSEDQIDIKVSARTPHEAMIMVHDSGEIFMSEKVELSSTPQILRSPSISGVTSGDSSVCLFTVVKSDVSNGLLTNCKSFYLK